MSPTTAPSVQIEVKGLRKNFGDLQALRSVSFEARSGEIFGLLGPNGAGKSTAISCISGLLKPSAGSIRLLGYDVLSEGPRSRRQLGVVPQELAIYEDLSARENLKYWGAAYGLRGEPLKKRVNEVLSTIGLVDRATDPTGTFSGGMKRRLNFGCAVVHEPRVLLLNENALHLALLDASRRLSDVFELLAAAGAQIRETAIRQPSLESLPSGWTMNALHQLVSFRAGWTAAIPPVLLLVAGSLLLAGLATRAFRYE